jgi:hypothetical protein
VGVPGSPLLAALAPPALLAVAAPLAVSCRAAEQAAKWPVEALAEKVEAASRRA